MEKVWPLKVEFLQFPPPPPRLVVKTHISTGNEYTHVRTHAHNSYTYREDVFHERFYSLGKLSENSLWRFRPLCPWSVLTTTQIPRRVYFLVLLRRSLLAAQISLNSRKRGAKWLITMHAGMRGAVIGMRMTPRRPWKSSERKKR